MLKEDCEQENALRVLMGKSKRWAKHFVHDERRRSKRLVPLLDVHTYEVDFDTYEFWEKIHRRVPHSQKMYLDVLLKNTTVPALAKKLNVKKWFVEYRVSELKKKLREIFE